MTIGKKLVAFYEIDLILEKDIISPFTNLAIIILSNKNFEIHRDFEVLLILDVKLEDIFPKLTLPEKFYNIIIREV